MANPYIRGWGMVLLACSPSILLVVGALFVAGVLHG